MSRSNFKSELLAFHANSPQRAAEVEMAVDSLFESLDTLARFGHVLSVTKPEVTAYSGEEFPKTMYHDRFAPEGKIFHTEAELPTDVGWRPTPQPGGKVDQVPERDGPEDLAAPDGPEVTQQYPKKLYHKDNPGGIAVTSPDMERDYLSRGWQTEIPKRDFKPHSDAEKMEREGAKQLGKPNDPAKTTIGTKASPSATDGKETN